MLFHELNTDQIVHVNKYSAVTNVMDDLSVRAKTRDFLKVCYFLICLYLLMTKNRISNLILYLNETCVILTAKRETFHKKRLTDIYLVVLLGGV